MGDIKSEKDKGIMSVKYDSNKWGRWTERRYTARQESHRIS